MDKNQAKKDESVTPSLMDLLKKYTTRVDERQNLWDEGTRACRQQQKTQTDEIQKLKETVNKLQSKPSSSSDINQQTTNLNEDKTNINYKTKLEESETKYRLLEKKYRQLETVTVKQLQDKITQLERENNQMKVIKDRIAELCSCRQLTNTQIEQLKILVNKTNSNNFPIETIANKNDFHQQTIKLREILTTHNDELINKLEEIIKKKRKRDQYEDDLTDDNDSNH